MTEATIKKQNLDDYDIQNLKKTHTRKKTYEKMEKVCKAQSYRV